MFCLLSVGERSPEEDKSAGSGFERCAATARRVAGRTPAINCQASNKAESPVERPGFLFLRLKRTPSRKVRGFLLCGVCLPRWRCAYRGYGSVARTRCAAPPPGKIPPYPHHYLHSKQHKTPSWQTLRHNPLFPCLCAGVDRENRACEKKCECNHI
ncbi:hypothetical protein SAMN03159500_02758 [Klebsiella quasipneumoniae]|nr:hypothetical protein SAMN03159472_02627 [Klebsiella quasipneumoniae]SCX63145.1 hypothetical protein SAMN03159426_02750 [Klebsiella quasipneumoniae]SCY71671.1 hypothetical protein SAMN03159331_02761 [Klebsiella quasipneumoniae]SCY87471.1 hypothetical protein SAMN03159393_3290 [Klebsiella quasipneumoniae]SDA24547.1 hypothetical protein SAMN03159381_02350 [Klebsiella quasipneumoniae]